MIASLEGRVAHRDIDSLTIIVGGVGIAVIAPRTTIDKITGDHAFLHTRLIVREDSLTLYGFTTESERQLFDTFIKINGVGPKLAITMLSSLSIDNIRSAVVNERPEILTRVPGIGKKTAQKILFELKDKISVGLDAMPASDFDNVNADVMEALTTLGYSIIEAQSAIQSIPHDAPDNVEQRVLIALQYLGN